MKIVPVILGFAPFIAFSLLAHPLGVGWAAVVGLVIAIVVTVSALREGMLRPIPVVQAVILGAMAICGFLATSNIRHDLEKFGPSIAALLIGAYMLVTAASRPFTAPEARRSVPREVWHHPRFIAVNRRISTAWGLAVLILGICHLLGVEISHDGGYLLVRLAVNWVIPILAFWRTIVYSRRTAAAATATIPARPVDAQGQPS